MARRDIDGELAEAMSRFIADPLGHVMFSYPWDTDPAIQLVELAPQYRERFSSQYGPDVWACEFLDDLGAEIRERAFNGRDPVEPVKFATASGHGIGKSTLVAWIIKFIMDTRPFAKGTVTANTDMQLQSKTWAELGKWHRRSLTEHWFDFNTGRGSMILKHKQFPDEWFVRAQTSRKENSEGFAGQHSASSTSFYIFDEASGIDEAIFNVREGGLALGEPMAFDFGNPTRNSGRFFDECIGKLRHRYNVRQIDSRDVAICKKSRIFHELIEDYGIDSDIVKVRVLGQFPSAGSCQFIPTDTVDEAMRREVAQDRYAPLLIGVDVARFGDDDSVIYPRLGNDARSIEPERYSGLDTVQLTGRVVEMVRRYQSLNMRVSGLFVDGGGVGGGVVDQLRSLGFGPIEVQFGGKPTDSITYRYKSDEMWGRLRELIRTKLILPGPHSRLGDMMHTDLTQREFGYTEAGNKIHLETKKNMKLRGLKSPDMADALALTFAQEVAPMLTAHGQKPPQRVQNNWDYDPMETDW